jgi:2-keto-4-pentenoate hydratase/2-oxohepta-3-ene-1,7-dioic acid hydratase in catechol pathway
MPIRFLMVVAFVLAGGTALAAERFVRFQAGNGAAWGRVAGDTLERLSAAPYLGGTATGQEFALDAVTLLAPAEPSKVLAVALNYRSHAGDSGAAKPELFAKLPSSLIGPGADIVVPPDARSLHYEGELVVVIGRRARNVAESESGQYVFGVTAGNDVSERGWQARDVQWLRAKASDGFGPAGPMLVSGLDYTDLTIETRLNGRVEHRESTANLIHGVDAIVAYASRYFTLEPGDLIFTGTPGRTRPMRPGDIVEVEIEGIGILKNRVVEG